MSILYQDSVILPFQISIPRKKNLSTHLPSLLSPLPSFLPSVWLTDRFSWSWSWSWSCGLRLMIWHTWRVLVDGRLTYIHTYYSFHSQIRLHVQLKMKFMGVGVCICVSCVRITSYPIVSYRIVSYRITRSIYRSVWKMGWYGGPG